LFAFLLFIIYLGLFTVIHIIGVENSKAGIIIIIRILIVLCASGAFAYFQKGNNQLSEQTIKESEIKLATTNMNGMNSAEIGTYISFNHEIWNENLGWGGYKAYTFKEYHRKYTVYIEELNQVINTVENEHMKEDFKKVKELLTNTKTEERIKSLIQVHRIFQDLDIEYNGYKSKDYYDVTAYKGRG
jgi:hypothetical protein